ncbi:mitochondrial biogenesis AIM24-domain-containing protein [Obelidium mucronatum]|nr:mitochondrial biogenesis AIM24-domain-containing protein [Obelidium mucronatum]
MRRSFASVSSLRPSVTKSGADAPPLFAATHKLAPPSADFDVADRANNSALLHVRLRPASRFVAAAGAVAAVSEGVESRLTTHTGLQETATRIITAPLNPQLYFSEFWTGKSAGSVFLGPPRGSAGEITVLRLGEPDGREVVVKRRSFVAVSGDDVVVKTELNADGLSAYRIYNSGSLAICAPAGSLHCISLSVNEEMLVDPELLVAWDAGIQIKHTVDSNNAALDPAPTPPARYVGGSVGDQVAAEWQERFAKIAKVLGESLKYLGRLLIWKGRKRHRMEQGPGDFYLASRRPATLSWLKHIPPVVFKVPKNGPK